MHRYILKRIAFLIPTILGVTFIIYAVLNITPSSPGQAILGPSASPDAIEEFNHQVGYDQPFLTKYFNYVKNMVTRADFGISYFTKQSVFAEVWPRFKVTIKLSLSGVALAALIGVPLGILAAVKQYSLLDTIPSILSFFIAAIPSFVLGMVLLLVFAQWLKILPSYGLDTWKHYIMPILAIAIPPAAQNMRFTKSSMLEAIRQDYVRTARAKGAPERTVIWKHALRNALMPVVTQIGMSLGLLICGSVVIEKMFTLPGIGSLIIDRINFKDEPIIIAGVILISICFTVVMLLVDIIYAFIDPRIKAKYSNAKG